MPTQHCECGAKYRFPDSAVGKRARCKKCGTVITLQGEEDTGIIAMTPEDPSPPGGAVSDSPAVQGEIFRPNASVDPRPAGGTSAPEEHAVLGKRGYLTEVLWTVLFPANPASLIPFVFVWGFMAAAPMAGYVPLIGIFVIWIIAGWFAAYQFEVLRSAAAGEDDLPQPRSESGMISDMLLALLKWTGSWLLVMVPAIVYLTMLVVQGRLTGGDVIYLLSDGITGMMLSTTAPVLFKILVCAGIFIWPIIVLCIALDSFDVVYRLDLIVLTIIKTFPIYALTLVLLYGAVAANTAIEEAVVKAAWIGPGSGGSFSTSIAVHIAVTGVDVYMSIVVMRLIGLYYVHGKKRFAWSWE